MFDNVRSEKELFDEAWLGDEPETRTLELGSPEGPVRVRYWDSGRHASGPTPSPAPGTALVLVHGLFDSKRAWRYVWHSLAKGRRVVAPDLPGMGLSDKPKLRHLARAARYTPGWLSGMLQRTVNALDGLGEFVLAGHSFGGAVALLALLDESFARRVRGLVLLAAAAYPQKLPPFAARFRGFFGAIACCPLWHDRLAAWAIRRGGAKRGVEATYRLGSFELAAIPREALEEGAKVVSSAGFPYAARYVARRLVPRGHARLVGRFAEIAVPALVIWGRQDRIVPPENAARFERDLRNARVVTFDRCGHWPQIEKARETACEMQRFIEDVTGREDTVGEKGSG